VHGCASRSRPRSSAPGLTPSEQHSHGQRNADRKFSTVERPSASGTFVDLVASAKKPEEDALGLRLQWPETEPTSPMQRRRLGGPAGRKALPPASPAPAPLEATAGPANGVAQTLDRFTERIDVLTQAVDGLRSQLEGHSRHVEVVVSDVSDRLNTLKEAADEMLRLRVALTEQPKAELERQVTELLDEVKATRRSVAVSSGKRSLEADTVERIVRSVVERLTEGPPAAKKGRGRRPSVAG